MAPDGTYTTIITPRYARGAVHILRGGGKYPSIITGLLKVVITDVVETAAELWPETLLLRCKFEILEQNYDFGNGPIKFVNAALMDYKLVRKPVVVEI